MLSKNDLSSVKFAIIVGKSRTIVLFPCGFDKRLLICLIKRLIEFLYVLTFSPYDESDDVL